MVVVALNGGLVDIEDFLAKMQGHAVYIGAGGKGRGVGRKGKGGVARKAREGVEVKGARMRWGNDESHR